ncbi:MAG: FprA family A-type flavoprotein [Proteobacteria bacterium]|nr:FprA family A-type flavoprotein [Pseudomonadota bacterium]
MKSKKITDGVHWVGAVDFSRRLFDALVPLPDGTSYNAYLVRGTEKTALIDTVDPATTAMLMSHLDGVERIDYIVANHAEQDHSGAIPTVLRRHPNAMVVANEKCKKLLMDHLPIEADRFIVIEDRDTLELGGKTLEFISIPWVHWPETMVTYLREDKVLFSCDLFGSHLATAELYSNREERVYEAIKRYYAEVMMPFRTIIRGHLDTISALDIDIIAPSHGPAHNDVKFVMDMHRGWVSDEYASKVVLAFVSMHGSTERMVDYLTEALVEEGIGVERFDLSLYDTGRFCSSLVDAATIVFASPTFLTGAHPNVISAAFLANALRPKLKFAAIMGSFAWGSRMVEQVKGVLGGLKLEYVEQVMIKGEPKTADVESIVTLAREIKKRHIQAGIS